MDAESRPNDPNQPVNGSGAGQHGDELDRLNLSPEEKAELRRLKAESDALLTPELRAWALEQFSEEEFLAGMRDIEETGGCDLTSLIEALEKELGSHE